MGQAHSLEHTTSQRNLTSSHKDKHSRISSSKTLPLSNKDKEPDHWNTRVKIFTRFGTIRRKLAKSLKTGKHSDYRKHMRELLQNWPVKEIQDLLRQYEGLEAIKKLSIFSDAAQPDISTLENDILDILNNGICTDLVIDYNGKLYSLHKGIVSCRCKFFAKYLSAFKQDNDVIKFEIPGLILDEQTFSSLLRYIYTGKICDDKLEGVLNELTDKFGTLTELTHDLNSLRNSESHTDVVLMYLQEPRKTNNAPSFVSAAASHSSLDTTKLEVRCHSALLCARSAFFRSLVTRKLGERQNSKGDCRIIISDKILPRCFVRVVLSCIYTNKVDLSTVVKWRISEDGSGEVDRLLTTAELAMELYEIGQFLEIAVLSRGCELIILDNINSSSLLGILEWSSQPHGSSFIHRQAMQYFREEFNHLCKIPTFLCNLPKRFLLSAVKSDYLQANEEFVLHSIIKWGEWQISRAFGKSSGGSPGSSLLRRSPKRRVCSNGQLQEIISPLLSCVRLRHILPSSSSVLSMAFQRGLLERHLPLDLLSNENASTSHVYWLASSHHPDYESPRLFNSYVAEIKMILHERLLTDHGDAHNTPDISNNLPDMLPARDHSYRRRRLVPKDCCADEQEGAAERRGSFFSHSQLDETIIRDMVLMEKKLKRSPEALHVMSLVPDCKGLSEEIQLRVVRKFGLPDEMAAEVFGQVPDLVDSGSSSYSSKQNTLSRVGRILQDDENSSIHSAHQRKTSSLRSTKTSSIATTIANAYHSLSRVEASSTRSNGSGRNHGSSTYDSLSRISTDLMNSQQDNNRTSYAQSPLDLPFRDGSNSLTRDLPNVLLDT